MTTMAFSSSSLAIEQITFEAEDQRCKEQSVSSLKDLVSFDCEFPKQEFFSFNKKINKRDIFRSDTDKNSEKITS